MPKYDPAKWNKEGDRASNVKGTAGRNNCYNYALDKLCTDQQGKKLQPGEQQGRTLQKPQDCDDVVAAAIADGVKAITDAQPCNPPCWRIALFIAPPGDAVGRDGDFHWYREDEPGKWSHKMDGKDATNLDENGNRITDPRTAATATYSFCRFLCVCRKQLNVTVALGPVSKPAEELALALPPQDAIRVTAVLRSGAPNPVFDVPFGHLSGLRGRLRLLKTTRAAPPPRLGYRGFVLENPWRVPGLPWVTAVEAGIVTTWNGAGRRRRYADAQGLEAWLLARARRHAEGPAIAAAARAAKRSGRRA